MGNCSSVFKKKPIPKSTPPKAKAKAPVTASVTVKAPVVNPWTFRQPYPQRFDFPTPMLRYIMKNPKVWNKLIKTCKYFFSKYPLYASNKLLHLSNYNWNTDNECFTSENALAKLWLYGSFTVDSLIPNIVPSLIPKIGECHLKQFYIGYQHITWNEYYFLTSAGELEFLASTNSSIKYSDGTFVSFDELIKNQPNLETV